jgi:hypothetical protein
MHANVGTVTLILFICSDRTGIASQSGEAQAFFDLPRAQVLALNSSGLNWPHGKSNPENERIMGVKETFKGESKG